MPDGAKLASYPSEQIGFGPQSGFAATPDLSLAVYALPQGRIRVIDLRDGKELWTAVATKEFITALAFSPDAKTLASAAGFTESDIRLWDVATGKQIGQLAGHGAWDLSRRVLLHQWTNTTGEVYGATFLAGAKKLITWSERGHLFHEWNLTTGLEMRSWQGPAEFGSTLPLTPDERSCVAVGRRGHVVLRNLADESQRNLNLDVLDADVGSYSPDGKLFSIASSVGYARVWDTANWQPVATLGGFLKGAHSLAFSPDGKRLAVGSGDKESVKLWDTESWQDVFTLEAQGTGFMRTGFSPDDNTIAWGNTTTLYLWHAPPWAEVNAAEAKQRPESKQP